MEIQGGLGEVAASDRDDLLRLIMIETSAWQWPPEFEMCKLHQKMLERLVDPKLPGCASIRCATKGVGGKVYGWHPSGPPAEMAINELMDGLRRLCFEHILTPRNVNDDQLRVFRHRVHLDRSRLTSLIATDVPEFADLDRETPFEACLDFRFRLVLGELTCHLSLSLWSHTPWSEHHRPPHLPHGDSHEAIDLAKYRSTFGGIREAVEFWIRDRCKFVRKWLRVFDRPYQPPIFWIAVPRGAERTTAACYLKEEHAGLLSHLTQGLLDVSDIRQHDVTRSVIGGEVLVVRHFAPDGYNDVPRYLLLPGKPVPDGPIDDDYRETWLRDNLSSQEDRLRSLVTTLTARESEAAAQLFDIQSDLEILENHILVYRHVIERGNGLWDGMSAHLLHHRGRHLAEVHRSIELIHQTILQGVADVDQVKIFVHARASAITEASNQLRSRLTHDLREAAQPDAPNLCEALTQDGLFALVSRRAQEIVRSADRVAQSYRDLVQAISDAFDERRVRETDVLQRTTYVVGLFLGLVGLVTVLDTTFGLQTSAGQWEDWIRWGVWGVGAALILGLALGGVTWLRLGRLGSSRYRRSYRAVWDVLRFCSTDHLMSVAGRLDPDRKPPSTDDLKSLEAIGKFAEERRRELAAEWDEIDRRLATRYARAWDLVTRLPGDVRQPAARQQPDLEPPHGLRRLTVKFTIRRDLRSLSRMIEKWSLRTFLITERPREMWRVNLPRLTLLYSCTLQLLGREDFQAVSRMDFYFVFAGQDHKLSWTDVNRLHDWLHHEIRQLQTPPNSDGVFTQISALAALGLIEKIGIGADMVAQQSDLIRRIRVPAPVESHGTRRSEAL